MTKLSIKYFILFNVLLTFHGCFYSNLGLQEFTITKKKEIQIQDICKEYYKNELPHVAVIGFRNDSNFIYTIENKLSNALVSPLEDLLLSSKQVKLITREDFHKINDELKFQDSGLIRQDDILNIGKLLGAKYLVTTSLNSAEQNYRNNTGIAFLMNHLASFSSNEKLKIGALIGLLGSTVSDGVTIKTNFTIKILDVENSEILFTKNLENSKFIGQTSKKLEMQILEGIKASMRDALPEVKNDLLKFFSPTGYIIKIKSKNQEHDESIAQINLGKKQNIMDNDIFNIFELKAVNDPISNSNTCEKKKLPHELRISKNDLSNNFSWGYITGNAKDIKIGHIVEKQLGN